MHRFKYLILGKRYQSDPRKESLRVNEGEFALNHDFTECLSVKHNEEIQSSHFGQGCTVSIEGYTCHYRDPDDGSKLILDFHSYLSDNKTQNAATVQNHMEKLLEFLIESKKLLKRGGPGKFLCTTDGCAKQYKCSTSLYFMSVLAHTFGVVVDRAICCPGHGKSLVVSVA